MSPPASFLEHPRSMFFVNQGQNKLNIGISTKFTIIWHDLAKRKLQFYVLNGQKYVSNVGNAITDICKVIALCVSVIFNNVPENGRKNPVRSILPTHLPPQKKKKPSIRTKMNQILLLQQKPSHYNVKTVC